MIKQPTGRAHHPPLVRPTVGYAHAATYRLIYPKRLPEFSQIYCLYEDDEGRIDKLAWALAHPQTIRSLATSLHTAVSRFHWQTVAPQYDQLAAALACP